jgi:hypothetical protein
MSAEFPAGRLGAWPCGGWGMCVITHKWQSWQAFYYCRLPLAVISRVAIIVQALRECGHLRCIADVVAAQLARLQSEHDITGSFAAGWLVGTGRWP